MQRLLKRNHGVESPRRLLFVDTETSELPDANDVLVKRLTLKMGFCQYVRHNKTSYLPDEMVRITTVDDFWSEVKRRVSHKSTLWVFAHNLFFDLSVLGFHVLLERGDARLDGNGNKCNNCVNGSVGKCHCWKGAINVDKGSSFAKCILYGCRVNFIDSYNYSQCSLEQIGRDINLPKLDYSATLVDESFIDDYCKRDVEILREFICRLIVEWNVNGRGNWQLTAPSLAFSSYRHAFMDYPILIHDNKDVQEDESRAYYGGETRVFFRGEIRQIGDELFTGNGFGKIGGKPCYVGSVYKLDVNSLYPYVMYSHMYPSRYDGTIVGPSVESAKDIVSSGCCVASVQLDTSKSHYPYRCEHGVRYPIGRFWTTICGNELANAIECGDVITVGHIHLYTGAYLFKSWVKYWYANKEIASSTRNSTKYLFSKMMLNSLSGKFAQRNRKWVTDSSGWPLVEWSRWPRKSAKTGQMEICRSIGRYVQILEGSGYADHALVAISACITANAREYMRHLRGICGKRNVLYQDTDSLFVTEDGFSKLVDSGMISDTDIGRLKLEEVIENGSIISGKNYEINGRRVKAGLPKKSVKITDCKWEYDDFESGEDLINRRPDCTVIVRKRTHTDSGLCGPYYYDADGWEICPTAKMLK